MSNNYLPNCNDDCGNVLFSNSGDGDGDEDGDGDGDADCDGDGDCGDDGGGAKYFRK